MSIKSLVHQLEKVSNIASMLKESSLTNDIGISKDELKECVNALSKHLDSNNHKSAVAVMLVLLAGDANSAIAEIRRKGVLKSSKYGFRSSGVKKVVESALEFIEAVDTVRRGIRAERLEYLNSVHDLLVLAPDIAKLRNSLLVRLRARQKIVLKTLLVLVNRVFSIIDWNEQAEENPSSLAYWSAEDIAEAFSCILKMMREENIVPNKWINVDTNFGGSFDDVYNNLLVDAAKINAFKEAEVLIDALPYKVVAIENKLNVMSSDPAFEKSVRLGYIQSEIQRSVRAQKLLDHLGSYQTIESVVSEAFDTGLDDLVTIKSTPLERLVFELPATQSFLYPICQEDILYSDEAPALIGMAIDDFLPATAEPREIKISEFLNVFDAKKVQRLFRFINIVYNKKLETISDINKRRELLMRSTIMVFKHEQLLAIFSAVLSPEKAEEMIKLLTLSDSDDYIDIQYKPLIKSNNFYIVAPMLLGSANLSRNIVVSNNLRNKLTRNQVDPLEGHIENALIEQGFTVAKNFKFKIAGEKRETDIICWRENHLFIFECKNSYLPCNPHEMRTSYEHIKKGEEQLEIRYEWLCNHDNQKRLLKALKWDFEPTDQVHTGIITANRVFNGLNLGRHPVRQAHELTNVLLRGKVSRSDGKQLSFWKQSEFSVCDLVDYLKGGSIISMQLDNLTPYKRDIKLGKSSISFHRYKMDLESTTNALTNELDCNAQASDAVAP